MGKRWTYDELAYHLIQKIFWYKNEPKNGYRMYLWTCMVLTGLALAKGILVAMGVSAGVAGTAIATGHMQGLEIAIQNVSGHAHTVISSLLSGRNPAGR